MNRIAKASRPYRSELRAARAETTRTRILDATQRVMAGGLTSLSIPDIAHEAGVSIPTVYRHFRSKDDLLAALYLHLAHRLGLDTVPDPVTLDDLREGVRVYFDRLAQYSALDLAAVASPIGDEVRHATMPHRRTRLSRFADAIRPPLVKADRDRITRLLVVLTASASLRMWRDHLGSSVNQAADDIVWVMQASIAASQRSGR